MFVFPEMHTTDGGRRQSKEGSAEDRLTIDLAFPKFYGDIGD